MPNLTRRTALGVLPLVLMPRALAAATCPAALPGLRLCDVWGWGRDPGADGVLRLTHASGIGATITLETGLDAEGETWARWQQAHAPISARAEVLETALAEVDGRIACRAAWVPRHAEPPVVVAVTGYVGEGLALAVTTLAQAESFDHPHRAAHESLVAGLRLDLPE